MGRGGFAQSDDADKVPGSLVATEPTSDGPTMSDDATPEADELLRFLSRADRLERLPRTGWLVAGVQRPESVAAHGYEVALVALWLADNVAADLDKERVLRIALVHDLGEALLTDLPRPVKELVGRRQVEEAEAEATDQILGPLGEGWAEMAEAYRRAETDEARLVKAADRIQMLVKAMSYHSQSRGDVDRFFEGSGDVDDYGFPLVGRVLERLRERWEAEEWFANDLD